MSAFDKIWGGFQEVIVIRDHVTRLETDVSKLTGSIDRLSDAISALGHRVSRIDGWVEFMNATHGRQSLLVSDRAQPVGEGSNRTEI